MSELVPSSNRRFWCDVGVTNELSLLRLAIAMTMAMAMVTAMAIALVVAMAMTFAYVAIPTAFAWALPRLFAYVATPAPFAIVARVGNFSIHLLACWAVCSPDHTAGGPVCFFCHVDWSIAERTGFGRGSPGNLLFSCLRNCLASDRLMGGAD